MRHPKMVFLVPESSSRSSVGMTNITDVSVGSGRGEEDRAQDRRKEMVSMLAKRPRLVGTVITIRMSEEIDPLARR